MQNLNLSTKSWICLRNKKTSKYFHFVESSETPLRTADAYGTPPSICMNQQKDNTTQIKIVLAGKIDEQQPLTYGSRVHFITSNNQYLASLADGGLKFDKLGLDEGQNKTLLTTSTWLLTDKNNNILKKPITVYDDVIFKSVYSTYLVCESEGWVTTKSNNITAETTWNIMKADVPFIPDWVYLRQPIAKNMTLAPDLNMFQNIKKDDKKPLSSFPLQVQQWLLIQDILDIMLGFEGVYIKKRGEKANFVIQSQFETASCDVSVSQLCQKILPIATNQYHVQNYITTHNFQNGIVAQAFCGGLILLLKEYKNMVISLDAEAGSKGLTLQILWSYVQPAGAVISALAQLTKAAHTLKGGALLTCIYKFMMASTDQMLHSIYKTLFSKAIVAYIEQLQNWIYSGVIVDKHKQFMVYKNQLIKDKRVNEWNQKYAVNKDMIPVFLTKETELILKTGKYLNVILECDKYLQNPHKNQISKNLEVHLSNNDFSEPIHDSYKWVSEKLINFMFKDKGLTTVLTSLKGFFLVDYGDVYSGFLEAAENQLCQSRSKNISAEKFETLLDLSIKTSSSKNDIFNEDIFCRIENTTIFEHINSIKRLEQKKFNFDPSYKPPGQNPSFKYFQAFVLDCKISFPLNLIINYQCLNKYQILFRHIFWFKYIEKSLNDTWLALQSVKQFRIKCMGKAHLLLQRMIHYCRSMMYYLFYEVIEKNWAMLMENLQKANTFEDIMAFHDDFLDRCLKQSMITNQKLMKIIMSDLGNAIQGFVVIKSYLMTLTADITSNIIERRPNNTEEYKEKHKSRKQYTKGLREYIDQMIQNRKLSHFIEGVTLNFDKGMKQFLEDLYRVLSKDKDRESMENLIYLLPRLDNENFYDKRLEIHKTDRKMYE